MNAAAGLGTGFAIDIGGSGIKGAPVDLAAGVLASERLKLATPMPSTPAAVATTVAEIVRHFGWDGPVGCTFPAVVTRGVARTAANVDKSWIGTDIAAVVADAIGHPVLAVNDADAAGVAEASFGAARDHDGLVVLTTLGTGIGTALIFRGELIPNSELGHIEVKGLDAETRASASARESGGLSWEKWASRLQAYYERLEAYLWPDLFVVGGGVSRRADKFLPLLTLRTPIVAAQLRNDAGIIGAALLAAQAHVGSPGAAPTAASAVTAGAGPVTAGAGPVTAGAGPVTAGAGPVTAGAGPVTAGAVAVSTSTSASAADSWADGGDGGEAGPGLVR
jgi:polyphosphate glucokinase